ncbi:MAG: hypothetical protein NTY61_00825 [Candidatus Parcubacteria bacterium]|nr:hypothetical protein [Candidatus Parcubacteria bacterium]
MQRQDFIKLILWIWRALLIAGVVLMLLWLWNNNLIASGVWTAEKDFCQEMTQSVITSPTTDFISDLYPADRVNAPGTDNQGRCEQDFFAEPVYFDINIPRSFDHVRLQIYYQNASQPLLQIGLAKVGQLSDNWSFQLQPLENQAFDKLNWFKIVEGGVTLWQKNKQFDTIEQFVNNVPGSQRVATFYYNLTSEAVKNPKKVIQWNYNTPMQYVDYLISTYQAPKQAGDLKVGQADFFIAPDFSDGRHITFMFSAPNLGKLQQPIKIYKIIAELDREPTGLSNLGSVISNFWTSVWNKLNQ